MGLSNSSRAAGRGNSAQHLHFTVILFCVFVVAVSQPSGTPSVSVSPSIYPSPSSSATWTVSVTATPSHTASLTATPTSTPFSCPGQFAAIGAVAQRPGVSSGYVECTGRGVCTRDLAKTIGGTCACDAAFDGTACESCKFGTYQSETCGACNSGTGICIRHADLHCEAPVAGLTCGPGHELCASTNRSSPLLRVMTCANCPGWASQYNASTGQTEVSVCSGHGTCSQYDGSCYCDAGYTGPNCSVPQPMVPGDPCDGKHCSGNGICITGACSCLPGYSGPTCSYRTPVISTFFWRASPWGACSRSCGSGSSQRTASCFEARLDVLQNNRTILPALNGMCNPFTRPALLRDCRQVKCGGSTGEWYMKLAFNISLLMVADTVDSILATSLLDELATVIHVGFPTFSVQQLLLRLQIISVFPASQLDPFSINSTIARFDWISSTTASLDIRQLEPSAVLHWVGDQLRSNSSYLRTSGSLLRKAVGFSLLEMQTLGVTAGTWSDVGIVVSNISATNALEQATSSLLSAVSVELIVGVAVAVGFGILALGCIFYCLWRASLKKDAKVGVWSGRDRRAHKDSGEDAAVVVVPDGEGGLKIVRTDSAAAGLSRRDSMRKASHTSGLHVADGHPQDAAQMSRKASFATSPGETIQRRASWYQQHVASPEGASLDRKATFRDRPGSGAGMGVRPSQVIAEQSPSGERRPSSLHGPSMGERRPSQIGLGDKRPSQFGMGERRPSTLSANMGEKRSSFVVEESRSRKARTDWMPTEMRAAAITDEPDPIRPLPYGATQRTPAGLPRIPTALPGSALSPGGIPVSVPGTGSKPGISASKRDSDSAFKKAEEVRSALLAAASQSPHGSSQSPHSPLKTANSEDKVARLFADA